MRPGTARASTLHPNVAYGPDTKQKMDICVPSRPPDAPVPAIVFVHGGRFYSGSKRAWSTAAARVAVNGWVGATIDYRLAPQPWHEQLDDVEAAVDYVRAHASVYGLDPNRIGIGGDSAGATLALGVAARRGREFVQAGFGWSGGYDLVALYATGFRAGVRLFVGCSPSACPDRYAYASAVGNVSEQTPPMRLVNSTSEIMPAAQLRALDAALDDAGVYDETRLLRGSGHATQYARAEWPSTWEFLRAQLG